MICSFEQKTTFSEKGIEFWESNAVQDNSQNFY